MKKLILIAGLLPFVGAVFGQNCNPQLPSSATVVNSDGIHSNSGDQLWVCNGVTLDISGDGNLVFVERNCFITISGTGNTVYQKKGGAADVTGDDNSLTHEDSFNPTNTGMMNTILSCDTIHVDYSVAPSSGCDPYIGISTNMIAEQIRIYPNPATSFVQIDGASATDLNSFELYNVRGQMVLNGTLNADMRIDVSNMEKGIYFLNLNGSNESVREQITIQ